VSYTLREWLDGFQCVLGDGCWGFSHFDGILVVLTSSWVLIPPLLIIIRFKHHETSLLGCMTPKYTLGDWFHGVDCVLRDGCWGFSHFDGILVVLTSSWVATNSSPIDNHSL
jgi:hypothetical protein